MATAVVAVAWSAALYVHQRHVTKLQVTGCEVRLRSGVCPNQYVIRAPYSAHPHWEDPAAVLIALGGLAVAVGIVFTRHGN